MRGSYAPSPLLPLMGAWARVVMAGWQSRRGGSAHAPRLHATSGHALLWQADESWTSFEQKVEDARDEIEAAEAKEIENIKALQAKADAILADADSKKP